MNRITEQEARKEILARVVVSKQNVTLAEDYLLCQPRDKVYESLAVVSDFTREQGHTKPDRIILHRDADIEADLTRGAEYFTSVLSIAEAIWLCIHEGILIHSSQRVEFDNHIRWTTIPPQGGSGQSGGWTLEEFRMELPRTIAFSFSHRRIDTSETLTNPNLFLLESGISGADAEVVEALQDSVNCFRKRLFRPAVVLLGKAMEGAWVEAGIALAQSVSEGSQFNKSKFVEKMTSETPVMKKIDEVLNLYKNKNLIGDIPDRCGVRTSEVENIIVWSKVLQMARNAIHFGVKPIIPNSYEKVAVLLLSGAENLSKLYLIKKTAETI